MEYKILNEEGIPIAEFMNQKDRDDCFDEVFMGKYDDLKWKKAKGENLEEEISP